MYHNRTFTIGVEEWKCFFAFFLLNYIFIINKLYFHIYNIEIYII